jgi:hypothetical protein
MRSPGSALILGAGEAHYFAELYVTGSSGHREILDKSEFGNETGGKIVFVFRRIQTLDKLGRLLTSHVHLLLEELHTVVAN